MGRSDWTTGDWRAEYLIVTRAPGPGPHHPAGTPMRSPQGFCPVRCGRCASLAVRDDPIPAPPGRVPIARIVDRSADARGTLGATNVLSRTYTGPCSSTSRAVGKANPYLKGVLGEATAAAAKTDTLLGARYRRIVRCRGKLKALVAVARSILTLVWQLLAEPTTRYRDLGADYHTTRHHPQDPQPHRPTHRAGLPRHPRTSRLNTASPVLDPSRDPWCCSPLPDSFSG